MTQALHMVQVHLHYKNLMELGRCLRLSLAKTEVSYLVHCALGELFGNFAPKPFALTNHEGSHVSVLGYAKVDMSVLMEHAKGLGSMVAYKTCDWERASSKPMPDRFPQGLQLGFELKSCPVVRTKRDGRSVEMDAFLAACARTDDPLVREDVYMQWLGHKFEQTPGVKLLSCAMEQFDLESMTRRTHTLGGGKRKSSTIRRPSVLFRGALEVKDSNAFQVMLHKGIGRHKAFGFGMIKLRRM